MYEAACGLAEVEPVRQSASEEQPGNADCLERGRELRVLAFVCRVHWHRAVEDRCVHRPAEAADDVVHGIPDVAHGGTRPHRDELVEECRVVAQQRGAHLQLLELVGEGLLVDAQLPPGLGPLLHVLPVLRVHQGSTRDVPTVALLLGGMPGQDLPDLVSSVPTSCPHSYWEPIFQVLPTMAVQCAALVVDAIIQLNLPDATPRALTRKDKQALGALQGSEIEGVEALQQVGVQDRRPARADVAYVVRLVGEAHALAALRQRALAPQNVELRGVLLQLLRRLHRCIAEAEDHHRLALVGLPGFRNVLIALNVLRAVHAHLHAARPPEARGHDDLVAARGLRGRRAARRRWRLPLEAQLEAAPFRRPLDERHGRPILDCISLILRELGKILGQNVGMRKERLGALSHWPCPVLAGARVDQRVPVVPEGKLRAAALADAALVQRDQHPVAGVAREETAGAVAALVDDVVPPRMLQEVAELNPGRTCPHNAVLVLNGGRAAREQAEDGNGTCQSRQAHREKSRPKGGTLCDT
mmetsp:Transcript_77973/g.215600  ORF Transcript_77973/g.215600 Transcript_77973/m.215600 type:complete len:529 (+) Transcript_77973:742-2328(+)